MISKIYNSIQPLYKIGERKGKFKRELEKKYQEDLEILKLRYLVSQKSNIGNPIEKKKNKKKKKAIARIAERNREFLLKQEVIRMNYRSNGF
jgi:hypothetical protein